MTTNHPTRRTSSYSLRVQVPADTDPGVALSRLRLVVTTGPLTDSHTEPGIVAVGYRAAGDAAALAVAVDTWDAYAAQADTSGWDLITGYGMHARSVAKGGVL